MEVLEDQQQAGRAGADAEQPEHGLEEAQLALHRVAGIVGRLRQLQLREQPGQLPLVGRQLAADAGQVGLGQVVADRLQEGEVGKGQLRVRAAAPHGAHAGLHGGAAEIAGQARLAQAGVARQDDRSAVALAPPAQRPGESLHLALSTDGDRAERRLDHHPNGNVDIPGRRRHRHLLANCSCLSAICPQRASFPSWSGW